MKANLKKRLSELEVSLQAPRESKEIDFEKAMREIEKTHGPQLEIRVAWETHMRLRTSELNDDVEEDNEAMKIILRELRRLRAEAAQPSICPRAGAST